MMHIKEPTLNDMEDYHTKGSVQKRLTVWIVILSGLLVGSLFSIIDTNTSVSDTLVSQEKTGIIKH